MPGLPSGKVLGKAGAGFIFGVRHYSPIKGLEVLQIKLDLNGTLSDGHKA